MGAYPAESLALNEVSHERKNRAVAALTGLGFTVEGTERTAIIVSGPDALFAEKFGVEPTPKDVKLHGYAYSFTGFKDKKVPITPEELKELVDIDRFVFKQETQIGAVK